MYAYKLSGLEGRGFGVATEPCLETGKQQKRPSFGRAKAHAQAKMASSEFGTRPSPKVLWSLDKLNV